jgi:ACS family D-galactonate transporter-like MFS transporter
MSVRQWTVIVLLAFSVFINYFDRGNLSVAAPQLTTELSLNPSNMGILLSAFFWTYAICQLLGGWLVDRFDVRIVYGLGFIVWSLATAGTGFVTSFSMLLLFRLLLGIGECVSYPAYSKILAGNFPESHRGIANALIDAGSKAGPAFGTLAGGMIVAELGWRWLFFLLGFGSLLWVPLWFIWGPRDRALAVSASAKAPDMSEILRRRDAWGTFFGLFCGNYVWYFLITWLPLYLVKARGFSLQEMAILGSLPFFCIALGTMAGGYLSDRMIARGMPVTRVRKGFVVAGFLLALPMVLVAFVADAQIAIGLLVIASFCFGFYSSNLWAITQTLAGPAAAGKWTGMQNGFGNLAGVVAPALTGFVVEATGSFQLAFVSVAVMLVFGAISFGFVIGQVKETNWAGGPATIAARRSA